MTQASTQRIVHRTLESQKTRGLRLLQVVGSLLFALVVTVSSVRAQISAPGTNEGSGAPGGNSTSTTSICPVRLIGTVDDIDGAGNRTCRYKIFVASDCAAQQYRIDLPCNVNKSDCQNGTCATAIETGITPVAPPDPNAIPEIPNNPMPTPQPVVDPVTIPGYDKTYAASSLATGLLPSPAGSTRSIVPVARNTRTTIKYARYTRNGVDKYFKLVRLEVTEADGSKLTIGTGFEIPTIPVGETAVPTLFRPIQNKTYQVEEYSNNLSIEWTYIVHENR